MSRKPFESRSAVTTLLVLSLAAPAAVAPLRPALGQSTLSPYSLDIEPLRNLPEVPAIPGVSAQPPPAETRPSGRVEAPPGAIEPYYGAPRLRPRLPRPYPPPARLKPPPFSGANPLPPLEAYKTSVQAKEKLRRQSRMRLRGLRGAIEPTRPPPPTVAVLPTIPTKPKPRLEADPYAPLGFGIGSLRLYAYAEPSYGFDSNPNRLTSNVYGSKFFRIDGGLRLRSEWKRDELRGDLRLGYVDYFSVENADRPDGAGNGYYRHDISRDTSLKIEGRFSLDTQRPGAPGIVTTLPNVVVVNRPAIILLGTAVGLTHKFGDLEATLRGVYDRWIYQNAYYNDGSTLDLSGTSYNDFGINPRLAYQLNPSMKPFVEALLDNRTHDSWLDPYGYARDSTGAKARAGTTFKVTDLLIGEAAAGYAQRDYADIRLPRLRGPIIDAALIYTPTPLTTVTLRAGTTFSETTLTGAAGILSRNVTLDVTHAPRRNLTISATGSFQTNSYQGADRFERVATAGVKLEYKLTRSISIKGSYFFQRLLSSAQNSNFTAHVIMGGLRFEP